MLPRISHGIGDQECDSKVVWNRQVVEGDIFEHHEDRPPPDYLKNPTRL